MCWPGDQSAGVRAGSVRHPQAAAGQGRQESRRNICLSGQSYLGTEVGNKKRYKAILWESVVHGPYYRTEQNIYIYLRLINSPTRIFSKVYQTVLHYF